MNQSLAFASIEAISLRIHDFSNEIAVCFENLDWDKLVTVLSCRQSYLETVLSYSVDEQNRLVLANLVDLVLNQDAESLLKIQDEKKKLFELLLLLENGQRAVKAYRVG